VDPAPVAGLLSDDLLDVYVRVGLDLWRSPRAAAIWEWRVAFDSHWGAHAGVLPVSPRSAACSSRAARRHADAAH